MAAADRIELSGLVFSAVVGVLAEERTRAQPLRADLALEVDLSEAGISDDLSDTVDYGAICDAVVAAASAAQPYLLERMAAEMADVVLDSDFRITRVEVALAKLRPPVPEVLESAGVRITRRQASTDGL